MDDIATFSTLAETKFLENKLLVSSYLSYIYITSVYSVISCAYF